MEFEAYGDSGSDAIWIAEWRVGAGWPTTEARGGQGLDGGLNVLTNPPRHYLVAANDSEMVVAH